MRAWPQQFITDRRFGTDPNGSLQGDHVPPTPRHVTTCLPRRNRAAQDHLRTLQELHASGLLDSGIFQQHQASLFFRLRAGTCCTSIGVRGADDSPCAAAQDAMLLEWRSPQPQGRNDRHRMHISCEEGGALPLSTPIIL